MKEEINYKIEEVYGADRKSRICEKILRRLPEWFEIEEAIQDYIEGVRGKYFLAARVNKKVVGFLAVTEHNKYTGEIYVIGVLMEFQKRGIGKKLINRAEEMLKKKKKRYLTVKTLGPGNPDLNYEKTRKFYKKVGFYPLEEFKDLWDEQNPCLFMVKNLN